MHSNNDIFIRTIFKYTILKAGVVLAFSLLNFRNTTFPPLRCDGMTIIEPTLSHKYKGDTITLKTLVLVVVFGPLVEVSKKNFLAMNNY